MTNNQIQFFKAREEARHNLVQEEIGRGNIEASRYAAGAAYASAAAAMAGVAESRRHNVQTESINWYSAENQAKLTSAQAKREQAQTVKVKAEAFRTAAEADYVQAQTQYLIGPQSLYTLAQTEESGARTGLIGAQTRTEGMRPYEIAADIAETHAETFREYSQGIRNFTGIVSDYMPLT